MIRSFRKTSAMHFDNERRLLERARTVLNDAQVVDKLTSYYQIGACISIPLTKGADPKRLAEKLTMEINSTYRSDIAPRIEFRPDADAQLGPHITVVVKANGFTPASDKETEARQIMLNVVLLSLINRSRQDIDLNYMYCDAYSLSFLRT